MTEEATFINVWTVHSEDDSGCIRDLIGVCTTREKAEAMAFGKGAWSGYGTVDQRRSIHLPSGDGAVDQRRAICLPNGDVYLLDRGLDTPVELDVDRPAALKKARDAARAKLTDEEAALLGIR